MQEESTASFGSALGLLWDGMIWVLTNILMAFQNVAYAVSNPSEWLDWTNKESIMRFVYYGGSVEFFFVAFTAFLVFLIIGIINNRFMWGCVRALEGLANSIGRFFAWAGLLMVLQQIIIIFMQRVFTRPDIIIGFGIPLQFDISWYAEELKLYNALVVALCVTYTFVQGGHVRVDLIYSAVSFRTKRVIDMVGSMIFMVPSATLIWMYGWFFMWRHLIVPKPSASDSLERLLKKSSLLRWNVETIGFSPNGFTAYFLFKILLVTFAGLVFLQAVSFFFRSYLEFKEGPESEGKHLDRDNFTDSEEALEGAH
ncbi:MAG: C4-dicarboxylate ABC transporter permease [Rhodobacteraceae bacterium]|nr:C4-dicarboxylate ABC transporter permease [Paracoccaceae bacterium]